MPHTTPSAVPPAVPTTALRSLTVSRMGLGCMGMTMAYGRKDPQEGIAAIRHALDRGVTLLDTADMYANGRNETLVGKAVAGQRDEAVIASKCGILTAPVLGLPRGVDGRPEYIRRSAENSLRRLGVETIDLYYLHRVDPRVPVEDSVGALSELVQRGLVREIGLSEVSAVQLRAAHQVHPVAAIQMEWSIVSRELESEVLPVARELGVGIVSYSPLGRGMLTAHAEAFRPGLLDYRRYLPRWSAAHREANLELAGRVRQIAERHQATAAQVALAWLLARGQDVIPIPGTSRPARVEENLGALELALDPADLKVLDALTASGPRYRTPGGVATRSAPADPTAP